MKGKPVTVPSRCHFLGLVHPFCVAGTQDGRLLSAEPTQAPLEARAHHILTPTLTVLALTLGSGLWDAG